jgi:hypothetical protein
MRIYIREKFCCKINNFLLLVESGTINQSIYQSIAINNFSISISIKLTILQKTMEVAGMW